MKTFLQPIALFATIFFIALAVLAMAACLAEDTVTPAVQGDSAVEVSRPKPPVPSPVPIPDVPDEPDDVEGRRRDKDDCDCDKKPKPRPAWEGAKRFVGGVLNGAGDFIRAYLGWPYWIANGLGRLITLGFVALFVISGVKLISIFKGK